MTLPTLGPLSGADARRCARFTTGSLPRCSARFAVDIFNSDAP